MIPTVESIVEGLVTGLYSREQAMAWITIHAGRLSRSEQEAVLNDPNGLQALIDFHNHEEINSGHDSYHKNKRHLYTKMLSSLLLQE